MYANNAAICLAFLCQTIIKLQISRNGSQEIDVSRNADENKRFKLAERSYKEPKTAKISCCWTKKALNVEMSRNRLKKHMIAELNRKKNLLDHKNV